MEISEQHQKPQVIVEATPPKQVQNITEATPSRQPEQIRETTKPGEDRIVLLTDGIFAIALTLLVLSIQVPVTHDPTVFSNLFKFDGDFFTNTRSYIITFGVLISYWRIHRRLMNNLERIDNTFISINVVFLAFVAFFPATNSLLRNSQFREAVIIYTVVLAGCGYSAALLVIYAFGNRRLVADNNDFRSPRSLKISTIITPTFFLMSLLLLLIPNFDPGSVFYYWLILPIGSIIYTRAKKYRNKSA
ncbi:MAG: DUF1211 domain-containing protein [Ktedonobacteraceae bacterium]|nr:DUF1211 domain-containing protein [Ktedonobacteraceae bacterium]